MFLSTLNETILSIWPQLTIFIVILVSVRFIAIKNSHKKFSFHDEFLSIVFMVYIILLFELLTGAENASGARMNLVPFSEIFRYKVGSSMFIYNVLGNIVLFVPYGYFVSRYANAKNTYQIFIVSLITSFTVELLQVKLGRSFDVDDIILNVIGGIVGYFVYKFLESLKKHLPKFLQKDFIYDILCFIILVVIILYLVGVIGGTI